jgi:hypothetical protein
VAVHDDFVALERAYKLNLCHRSYSHTLSLQWGT